MWILYDVEVEVEGQCFSIWNMILWGGTITICFTMCRCYGCCCSVVGFYSIKIFILGSWKAVVELSVSVKGSFLQVMHNFLFCFALMVLCVYSDYDHILIEGHHPFWILWLLKNGSFPSVLSISSNSCWFGWVTG